MSRELSKILELAMPATLGMLAAMGMGVFDVLMVNPLGSAEVSAVALGHVWGITGVILAIGVARALDPVVSQAWGAQDLRAAGLALARNLLLVVPVALLSMGWYHLAPWGLALMGEPADLIPRAAAYAAALSWSLVPMLLFQTFRQYLASCGIMRPTTIALVVGLILKIPLNLVLIRGWGPVPAMGAVGAAWATAICESALLFVLLGQTWRIFRDVWPREGTIVEWAALRKLTSTGLSLGLQMGTELWAFGAIAMMAGWQGETALAAHTAVINLASVVFMVPLGISTAASTRVGNLLGEAQPWKRAAGAAYLLGGGVAFGVVALFLLVPNQLVALYQVSPEVRPLAVALVFVAACMHFLDATQVITFGVLRGAGDVRVPTLANVLGYYAIGLPVAWLLGLHQNGGPAGLWWGLVAGQIGVVSVLLWRLRHTIRRGGYRVG